MRAVMTLQPPKPTGGKKDEGFAGTLKKVDAFIMKLGGHKPRPKKKVTYQKPSRRKGGSNRVKRVKIGRRYVMRRR